MEATANNVANLTTPGFKSESLYSDVSAEADLRVPKYCSSVALTWRRGI
jgi:flagellar basal body rod protein FlgG